MTLATKEEYAAKCRVSVRLVEYWIEDGLPVLHLARRPGGRRSAIRIRVDQADEWVEKRFAPVLAEDPVNQKADQVIEKLLGKLAGKGDGAYVS